MKKIIECHNVRKVFDNKKVLAGVGIELEKNKIYGLLGQNGAGKTTLLKIIANQIFADQGTVKVAGQTPYGNEEILDKICLVKEDNFYPDNFKVEDILTTARVFYPNWDDEFAAELVERFTLDVGKKYKKLSNGMQSAVAVIIGLASRAPITLFDEAYLGLDASKRQTFYDFLLQDYNEYPRTIIFSTHLIDECSTLLEEVIILHQGQILLQDNINSINEQSFYIAGRDDKVAEHVQNKEVLGSEKVGKLVSKAVFSKITEEEKRAMNNQGLVIEPLSLQELFIYLTSEDRRDESE